MKCGGYSKVEANPELIELVHKLKDDLELSLIEEGRNGRIEALEILEAYQQVVAGLNYWFKLKLQENGEECIFIKVFRDLGDNITIKEIVSNKKVSDILEF